MINDKSYLIKLLHEHNYKYKDRLKREYTFSDLILHIITKIYCICRDFLFQITTPKIIATNPRCTVKPCVVSNLSEPIITFNLCEYHNIFLLKKNKINSLYRFCF